MVSVNYTGSGGGGGGGGGSPVLNISLALTSYSGMYRCEFLDQTATKAAQEVKVTVNGEL